MNARNEHVTNTAKENMKEAFGSRPVSVFCVSDRDYAKARNPKEQIFQYQGSSILTLRMHYHQIPARAQFRHAKHFRVVRIPYLLQQTQLWLKGASKVVVPSEEK
jgi:hypothetical protein